MDIVINHRLVDRYNIDRSLFDWERYCWIETVFKGRTDILPNMPFLYYYNELNNQYNSSGSVDLLGNHTQDSESSSKSRSANKPASISDAIKVDPDINTYCDSSSLYDESELGSDFHHETQLDVESTDIRLDGATAKLTEVKIDSVDKLIALIQPKKTVSQKESWTKIDRRYMDVCRNSSLCLPAHIEFEQNKKKDIFLFVDTSGSCRHMFHYMVSIAKKLMLGTRITCRAFCFGDDVAEISTSTFSGTYYVANACGFDGIETICAKQPKYPDNIIVISDGGVRSNNVNKVKNPKAWIQLLTAVNPKLLPAGGVQIQITKSFFK